MSKKAKIIIIACAAVALLGILVTITVVVLNKDYATVTFVTDGTPVETLKVRKGQKLESEPETVKNGYAFLGWFTDSEAGERFYVDEAITADTVLYASFSEARPDIAIGSTTEVCSTISALTIGTLTIVR